MIITIILIIVIFTSVVLVHEWGHFATARRNGIEVEEFGIGFPPRALAVKKKGTVYSLNWIPLGGFVRMKGEDGNDTSPGTYGAASIGTKAKVLMAGVGMNFLMAYVILTGLAFVGLPQLITGQFSLGSPHYAQEPAVMVATVSPGSPAEEAKFKTGTIIISADGQKLTSEEDLTKFTKAHAGEDVVFIIKKSGGLQQLTIKLNKEAGNKGYLGVVPMKTSTQRYGLASPIVAAGIMLQLVWRTLVGLVQLFVGLPAVLLGAVHRQPVESAVAGPIGIFQILSSIWHLGWTYIWVFIFTISLSLGVINSLPIPPLDGGQLSIAWLKHKQKLSQRAEYAYRRAGLAFVVALILIVTFIDLSRNFL